MKWEGLLLFVLLWQYVHCNVFEVNVDKSIRQVSMLIESNALNTNNYKLHPDTALLKLNGLRNTVVGLATTVRHLLIIRHKDMDAKLLNQFDVRFSNIPLPTVLQKDELQKLERQLIEVEWTLNNLKSSLQLNTPRFNGSKGHTMLTEVAKNIIDHLKKYRSIMLTGQPL